MKDVKEIFKANKETNNVLTQKLIESVDNAEEYIKDGDIYCKECNTPRTCFGFTKKVRCLCECQSKKYEEQKEFEQRAERLRQLEKLKVASLLGERYKNVTFGKTDMDNDDFVKVADRARKYCAAAGKVLEQGVGIYLYGAKGTGKTHLTACIANELMSNYYSVLYTNFSEISKSIRATYGSRSESEQAFIDKLATIDFLFIDDFGTESVARDGDDLWLQEKIFEVVNKRYNANKPIIFTSNYSLADMIKNRGLADKTVDRISEMCEVIKLDGKSYRLKAKEQREKLF
jgi:DNA replication protein DnaC